MAGRVILYQLTAKFVDSEMALPDDARDIMYYTLSMGHHTGVMDCFTPKLMCSMETYRLIIDLLPEGDARRKLEGIVRFGEIQIDKSHLAALQPALRGALQALFVKRDANPYAAGIEWLRDFLELLEKTRKEEALYLMARRIDD